ncbi:hypothetical protein F5Y11DRAFT_353105 [Daldinia sp. FL1419]|nr:hypothetical protein F5Y11DRAFT_353105 [Daldinia sp. FL1419]
MAQNGAADPWPFPVNLNPPYIPYLRFTILQYNTTIPVAFTVHILDLMRYFNIVLHWDYNPNTATHHKNNLLAEDRELHEERGYAFPAQFRESIAEALLRLLQGFQALEKLVKGSSIMSDNCSCHARSLARQVHNSQSKEEDEEADAEEDDSDEYSSE